MTESTEQKTKTPDIRRPKAKDAQAIHRLIEETGAMDLNSEYAYMLLGEHFGETCAVAEEGGEIIGYTSAYMLPDEENVLFVWQIAVSDKHRKRGLARLMLQEILDRDLCKGLRYIHATIARENKASRGLFTSLANDMNVNFHDEPMFPSEYFSGQHEDEPLFVIGPLP